MTKKEKQLLEAYFQGVESERKNRIAEMEILRECVAKVVEYKNKEDERVIQVVKGALWDAIEDIDFISRMRSNSVKN